jgi:hypothetical protein
VFACLSGRSEPDKVLTTGLEVGKPYQLVVYVWIWSVLWWFVMDAAKILTRVYIVKYNIFNVNDSGIMAATPKSRELKELLSKDAEEHSNDHQ